MGPPSLKFAVPLALEHCIFSKGGCTNQNPRVAKLDILEGARIKTQRGRDDYWLTANKDARRGKAEAGKQHRYRNFKMAHLMSKEAQPR